MTLHFMNAVVNDIESAGKSQLTCKLINRIPGLGLLISSLPGLASSMHVKSTSVLEALPGKLDIERHSLSILYIYYAMIVCYMEKGYQISLHHFSIQVGFVRSIDIQNFMFD